MAIDASDYFRKAALVAAGALTFCGMPSSLEQSVYAGDESGQKIKKNTEKSLEEKVVDRINFYRKIAGLDSVALDPEISKACKAHADYMVMNNITSLTHGLMVHDEDPKLPGYTKEGAQAGSLGTISFIEPLSCVDELMGTFYHRPSLIDPRSKEIGVGYVNNKAHRSSYQYSGWFVVICLRKPGKPLPKLTAEKLLVIYPAPNQKDVPTRFTRELPNPLESDEDGRAGFPITLTWYTNYVPKFVSAELKDRRNKNVELLISSPENPLNAEGKDEPTICLIPKDPLKGNTTYTVNVSCENFLKTW